MSRSIARRTLLSGLASLHLLTTLLITAPAVHAQPIDSASPVITFEPLEESRRGARQVFSASVADDVGVDRVVLHYRSAGTERYESTAMTPLGDTSIYTASIESPGADVGAIEFYIEARDEAGNRSIEGFAFDPLERRLVDPVPLAERGASESVPAADGMSTRRKVLYGVLGVLAVGALAAAASGSGGGDDGDDLPSGDDPGGDVTVTITADPLF